MEGLTNATVDKVFDDGYWDGVNERAAKQAAGSAGAPVEPVATKPQLGTGFELGPEPAYISPAVLALRNHTLPE